MRHFYKHVLSGLVFWLLLSQSLSLFNTSNAAATLGSRDDDQTELLDNNNEEEGSEGRYFGDFIKLVKRELSDDVETGRSSSGIFNTTLAFTIPLFSFSLPDRATAGKEYTKQAALSLFGLAIVGGIAIIPYVWEASKGTKGIKTWASSSRANKNDLELPASVLGMIANVASLAGLDPGKCAQRSVCEVYRSPDRYGKLALPVRYFLLTQKSSRTDGTATDYQMAADFGRNGADECDRRYRCAFSLIGAVNFLVSYMKPAPPNVKQG